MRNFDIIFDCLFLSVLVYQIIHFSLQYFVLKRKELIFYNLFLFSAAVFYYVFHTSTLFNIIFPSALKLMLPCIEMSFAFIQNYFYLLFIIHYLNLKNAKYPAANFVKYYSYYNLLFVFIFIILGFLKIESQNLFAVTFLLTVPLSIILVIKIWRLRMPYSNLVSLAITSTILGVIISYFFIFCETYFFHIKLPFSVYIPSQIGMMIDIIILGYGLSLKAAESDRKLVIALQTNQKLIEDERGRVAKDLHDGLGGLLSGIKMTLNSMTGNMVLSEQSAHIFTRALTQLDNAISEMRRVAHSMMPEALLRFGLIQAIQDYCETMNESKTVQITFKQFGIIARFDNATEIALYRIIQELVNNAVKHAVAKQIIIQLVQNEDQLTLTVEDDGKGFDTNIIKDINGFGLTNIQSRVDYLKGTLTIDSIKNIGTSVYITIPV